MAPSPVTRAERLAQIQQHKANGLTPKQIARELGLSPNTVRDIIADPTGDARRRRVNGPQPEAGEQHGYVSLGDVPLETRVHVAQKLCRHASCESERWALLAAALWPTGDEHRVAL